jgi:maleate isomerase
MTEKTPFSGPERGQAIGVVAPFDLELDREMWRWLPADVDILLTRTPFIDAGVTVEFAHEVSDTRAISQGTKDVTSGRATTVTYACTSGSFVSGRAGEKAITDAMLASGAKDALTTSGALAEALHAVGATRVIVATPYLADLSMKLSEFLGEFGIEALDNVSLGLCDEIWSVSYSEIADMIRAADRPDAEAIVISCTNLPTYDLIAPLEAELGKPIISANQATMWAALGRIGKQPVGEGQRLLTLSPSTSK